MVSLLIATNIGATANMSGLIGTSSTVLTRSSAISMLDAARCTASAGTTRKTAFKAVEPIVLGSIAAGELLSLCRDPQVGSRRYWGCHAAHLTRPNPPRSRRPENSHKLATSYSGEVSENP